MAEALMFPEIDAAAFAATAPKPSAVAVVATTTDLATIDLEAAALARFNDARTAIAKATETLTGVVHDLSTPTKLADAKSLRHRLINIPLADARKVSAGLKSKLTAVSKAVGATLVEIEADFETAEALITPQIKAREAELAAEEARRAEEAAAKAEEARQRAEKFEGELAKIRGYATAAKGLPSPRIAAGIGFVEGLAFGPEWEEYAPQAAQAQAETLTALRNLLAETKAVEDALAAAEAMRVESARLAAERAEQERAIALNRRRMEDIKRINGYIAEAQAAIIGKSADEAHDILSWMYEVVEGVDDGEQTFGDLAPMAAMAKSMVLPQLATMIEAALARAKQAQDDERAAWEAAALAATQAAAAALVEEVATGTAIATMEPADLEAWAAEHPARDWPDLQAAELACAPGVAKIEVFEPTPQQRAERWSPRVEVTFAATEPSDLATRSELLIDVVHPDADDTGDAVEPDCVTTLLAHIEKAREDRFPSHPKPVQAWWTELFRLAAEVQA